jgi:hypothetical protein
MTILLKAIKDFVSIGAALCVGYWAVYSMEVLKEKRIAELSVQAAELNIQDLEKTIEPKSPITASISTQEIRTDDSTLVVIATVKISNKGNEYARVEISNSVMELFNVDTSSDEVKYSAVKYLKPSLYISSSKGFLPYLDVSPQETYEISFATELVSKGTYYFNFLSEKSSGSTELHKEKTKSPSYVNYSIGIGKHVVHY